MAILRILKWIVITITVVVLAAVLYLSFADLSWMKPRIESAVADATGRRLQLAGDFDLDIVPSPSIVLENVSLSNADWGSEPMLATIGHVSARLGFWSLLAGPVRVDDLRLRDVDVLLETNEQGEENWVLGASAEPADDVSDTGGSVPVIIEFAELRDIKLRYQAPEAKSLVVSLASLDVSTDEEQYTVLDGKGVFDQLPWRLAGKLGPDRALAEGADIGIELNAGLSNVDLAVDGRFGDLAKPGGIDLELVASSDDVAQFLKHFNVDVPLTGALDLESTLKSVEAGTRLTVDAKVGEIAARIAATRQDNAVGFEAAVPALDKVGKTFKVAGLPAEDLALNGDVVVTSDTTRLRDINVRLGEAELMLNGSIGKATDSAAEFILNAKVPSLAGLNTALPPIPFTVATTVNVGAEQVTLDGIKTTFGESDLGGSLEIKTGDRTAVAGQLKSKYLDMTPFAGDKGENKADGATRKAEDDKPKSEYVFVDEPLPFEQLRKTDIDIKADIGRFTLDSIVVLDVGTRVDLKDGNLRFSNRFHGPHGGASASDISLSTSGNSAKLDVDVNLRNIHLNLLSGGVNDELLIPPVGVTVDVDSSGASPRALASSLNGRVLITAGKGQIQNNLVGKVSGDIVAQLAAALNPFSKEDPFTTLDCAIVAHEDRLWA